MLVNIFLRVESKYSMSGGEPKNMSDRSDLSSSWISFINFFALSKYYFSFLQEDAISPN